MKKLPLVALVPLLLAAPAFPQAGLAAQGAPALVTSEGLPDGWLMRLDQPMAAADMVRFSSMAPGWHVTTSGRGSGIFWMPAITSAGQFSAAVKIHLMQPAEHDEAFGLFVGGRDLAGQDQGYLYFLVRQNGQFLIKRRVGDSTETVAPWTSHDAVPTAARSGPTEYNLEIDVGPEVVDFLVNGATVHTLPVSDLETDGVVGIRINHMLDTHVETISVTQR